MKQHLSYADFDVVETIFVETIHARKNDGKFGLIGYNAEIDLKQPDNLKQNTPFSVWS